MLTAVQINAAITATGAAQTGAAIRGVGTEAETTGHKMGIMKSFMGSFLGQQLIFGLISKAIAEIGTQIRDIGAKTNAWDADLAQLNAVLASTHGQAGMTSQAVIDLANQMSRVTTYNNDAVLSTENLILTFTSIGKDIFPQTTQAVLDLATAMKEDTKSAAVQVGKALQDPVLGITALRRVGVNFSKDQIEVVKQMVATGHAADAQKLILAELNKEFGGSAAAAAGTFAGKLQVLQNQFDVTKEVIGNAVIPILSQLFTKLAPLVTQMGTDLPGALQTAGTFFNTYLKTPLTDVKNIVGDVFGALGNLIDGFTSVTGPANDMGTASTNAHDALKAIGDYITGTLTPAMKPLGQAIGDVVTALLNFTSWVKDNKPVLLFVATFIGVLLAQALYEAAAAAITLNLALLPEELIFLAIVAAIALVAVGIYELVTHWKDITTFFGNFFGAVGDFIGNVLGAVGDFAGKLIDLYTWPYRTAWDHIGPFVKGLLGFLGNFFGNILGIALRFGKLILDASTFPFRFAWAFIGPLLGFLLGKLGDFFGMVLSWIGRLGGTILGFIGGALGGLLGALGWVKDKLGDLAGTIGGFIGGAFKKFGDAWSGLGTIISNIWPGIQSGLKTGLNVVIGVLNSFIEFIDKISIHIPTISVGPVKTPGFDWNGLGIPDIPKLARGGVITGQAIVGDQGPELLTVGGNGAAMVQPLTTQHLGAANKTQAGGDTHIHIHAPNTLLTGYEVASIFRRQAALHRGQVR